MVRFALKSLKSNQNRKMKVQGKKICAMWWEWITGRTSNKMYVSRFPTQCLFPGPSFLAGLKLWVAKSTDAYALIVEYFKCGLKALLEYMPLVICHYFFYPLVYNFFQILINRAESLHAGSLPQAQLKTTTTTTIPLYLWIMLFILLKAKTEWVFSHCVKKL